MGLLDKATFIAQVSAPLALLATVVFSWLSYKEMRETAQIQKDIFAAQNAPNIKLSRISLSDAENGREIFLNVKNNGGSIAFNVCTVSYLGGQISDKVISNTCLTTSNRIADTGSESFVGAIPIELQAQEFDDKYKSYKIFELGEVLNEDMALHIVIRFKDTLGNHYSTSTNIYGVPK